MRRAWAAAAALTIGLCMNAAGQGSDKKSEGFKKKYVGKAAGAKGAYKGGKAERAKRGV